METEEIMNHKEALDLCRESLQKIIKEGDFSSPEGMKRIAKYALAATAPDKVSAEDVGPKEVQLNIIRYWPDGMADRLEHVWKDLIGFIPNYKLYDLQRMLAEFGFTMKVYEGAALPPSQPEKMPSNEDLEDLWEMHAGHPADFGADVLERWGGWMPGLLGQGGYLSAQPEKADAELPPLPEPVSLPSLIIKNKPSHAFGYTADQMQEYARAAIASQHEIKETKDDRIHPDIATAIEVLDALNAHLFDKPIGLQERVKEVSKKAKDAIASQSKEPT